MSMLKIKRRVHDFEMYATEIYYAANYNCSIIQQRYHYIGSNTAILSHPLSELKQVEYTQVSNKIHPFRANVFTTPSRLTIPNWEMKSSCFWGPKNFVRPSATINAVATRITLIRPPWT